MGASAYEERGEQHGGRPAPMLAIDQAGVAADVPVAGEDARLACRLRLEYRTVDPLVVTLRVQAPSRATVTEAFVLRADLRAALQRRVLTGSVVAEPGGEGLLQLLIVEGSTCLGIVVPRDLIEDFLSATRTLVGADDRSEARAVTESVRAQLSPLAVQPPESRRPSRAG